MATVYGTNATKRLVNVPQDMIAANAQHGSVRMCYDIYTLTADLAAADIIVMGQIPAGARVVGYWMKFSDLDVTGGTLNLGYGASADAVESASAAAFLSAVDVTSAGTKSQNDQANMAGLGKLFASPVNVQVATVGDTDATSGTIEVCIYYVVD